MQSESTTPGPLVSVVIPALNAEKTLGETLRSASGQTYPNLEIIVVSDASSDSTEAIARAHAEADHRVVVLRNAARCGCGGSRNRGAAEASGDYLCFLDADDLMASNAIEARIAAMEAEGADFCYAWSAVIDEDDRILRLIDNVVEGPSLFDDLVRRGNILGNGSCTLMKRQVYDSIGGYSERLPSLEDYRFYLEVAQRFRVACCQQVLIGYRTIPGNMSANTKRMLEALETVQEEIGRDHPECQAALRTGRDRYLLYSAFHALKRGAVAEALKLVARIGWRLPLMSGYLFRTIRRRGPEMAGAIRSGERFECSARGRPAA